MKPQLLKVTTTIATSFNVRRDKVPFMNNTWHYHPEIELIHIKEGAGTQFIGDNIKTFRAGDLVIIGSNLPHYWRFDEAYFKEDSGLCADVRVAHFGENFLGDTFMNLPENKHLKTLLEKAKRGIEITGESKTKVEQLLEKMLITEGTSKIICLLEALTEIAGATELRTLSSLGFKCEYEDFEKDRINAIYEYALANFRGKIRINEIASIANVSPNSFCRYFKSRTRKTFSEFMIEIRVGHACRLLIEDKINVKQVCFESGFNNFASFHKYFKIKTGKSPLSFKKEFMKEKHLKL